MNNLERVRLSAADIESLCLLHAVGRDGCPLAELAPRLGLSPALAEVMQNALAPLVDAGFVVIEELEVRRSDLGHRWLNDELAKHRAADGADSLQV